MNKWVIDKSFSFCYGHRVHNQKLDVRFTERGDACLACRHIHGHEGLIKLFVSGPSSNVEQTGMVTDFKNLGWLKDFVDDVLDHKLILDIDDPIIEHELPDYMKIGLLDHDRLDYHPWGYWTPILPDKPEDPVGLAIYEKYEGIVLVDFVPTSENLASWILDIARDKMSPLTDVEVVAVEYWETPKSHCRVV